MRCHFPEFQKTSSHADEEIIVRKVNFFLTCKKEGKMSKMEKNPKINMTLDYKTMKYSNILDILLAGL